MGRRGGGTSLGDASPASPPHTPAGREARLQARLHAAVPPLAFALAFALMGSPLGRLLSRIFLSMWVHELGHAIAAWLTGFAALPGPWLTRVSDVRRPLVTAIVVVLAAALGWRGWRRHRRWGALAVVLPAAIAALAVLGPRLPVHRARALITFAGDGGMLVLGAALAATFLVGPASELHRRGLRWGFLAIGAVAYADAATTWLAARRDPEAIPFGENEGAGPSDPTVLFDDHGWTIGELVGRHLGVAALAAVALVALWLWRLRLSRASLRSA